MKIKFSGEISSKFSSLWLYTNIVVPNNIIDKTNFNEQYHVINFKTEISHTPISNNISSQNY